MHNAGGEVLFNSQPSLHLASSFYNQHFTQSDWGQYLVTTQFSANNKKIYLFFLKEFFIPVFSLVHLSLISSGATVVDSRYWLSWKRSVH